MYRFFIRLRFVVYIFQFFVVLAAAYLILTFNEDQEFMELIVQPAYWWQFVLLALGYLLLAVFTSWLIRFRRPFLSKLRLNQKALSIYINRSYLVPI